MNDEIQVGATFHKKRVGKHIAMVEGPPPTAPERPKGRLPRITRYMALAIYYEDLIRQGHVHDYAEIATLGHVTRARVTQIMNLRLLATDIQEKLLTLRRIGQGRDRLTLRFLRSIALQSDWTNQRKTLDQIDVS
jgi:predicted XRE-type DNA-binding protein